MKKKNNILSFLLLLGVPFFAGAQQASVAFAGNAWVTKKNANSTERIMKNGLDNWTDPGSIVSIYFWAEQAGTLELSLLMKVPEKKSTFKISLGGKALVKTASASDSDTLLVGSFDVRKPGYVQVNLQGISRMGAEFGQVNSLIVNGAMASSLKFVKDNQENRFYWGRRGPSVHLNYQVPDQVKDHVEWFYNEITVPKGMDPVGSYFMSNGFEQGYFGMQVNGASERRILFSIWSPYHTDDPASIPEDKKIRLVRKGKDVHAGEFGSEGSGGQSYLIYPWIAGKTYSFLTRAQPDSGSNKTIFTSWFKPDQGDWILIASFERPFTNTSLKHLHSFLENFQPEMGYLPRTANYGNAWVADANGTWTSLNSAKFTGDDIAKREYRKDATGGLNGHLFFLKNGGFFSESAPLQSVFNNSSPGAKAPVIDFNALK